MSRGINVGDIENMYNRYLIQWKYHFLLLWLHGLQICSCTPSKLSPRVSRLINISIITPSTTPSSASKPMASNYIAESNCHFLLLLCPASSTSVSMNRAWRKLSILLKNISIMNQPNYSSLSLSLASLRLSAWHSISPLMSSERESRYRISYA